MDIAKKYRDQQEAKQLQNRISSFMRGFNVGNLLYGNVIRKQHGMSPLRERGLFLSTTATRYGSG